MGNRNGDEENERNKWIPWKNPAKVADLANDLPTFWQKIEIPELCKGVHCVDLGESFQTHIFLQNLASI